MLRAMFKRMLQHWHLNKVSASALVVVFLFALVQVGVSLHEARYGLDHKHGGKPCQISAFAEHAKVASAPDAIVLPKPILVALVFTQTGTAVLTSGGSSFTRPRSPPISFLL